MGSFEPGSFFDPTPWTASLEESSDDVELLSDLREWREEQERLSRHNAFYFTITRTLVLLRKKGVADDGAAGTSGEHKRRKLDCVESCGLCQSAAGKKGPILWQDDLWAVTHKRPPCGVVGHLQLISKRHVQGPSAFTAEEAAAVGPALRRCERVLEQVTGCDRVYTAALGSPKNPHFHAHMLPMYVAGHGLGTPAKAVSGTPFDVFLQEKLASDGVEGAAAEPAQCARAAEAFQAAMREAV